MPPPLDYCLSDLLLRKFGQSQWKNRLASPKIHFHTATRAQPQKNIVIPRSVPRMEASISVFMSSIVISCHHSFL